MLDHAIRILGRVYDIAENLENRTSSYLNNTENGIRLQYKLVAIFGSIVVIALFLMVLFINSLEPGAWEGTAKLICLTLPYAILIPCIWIKCRRVAMARILSHRQAAAKSSAKNNISPDPVMTKFAAHRVQLALPPLILPMKKTYGPDVTIRRMTLPPITLRLGTRGSLLARMQSEIVAKQLLAVHPNLQIETVIIQTTGDRVIDRPLHEIGGKGVFVKEIEIALLENRIDFAVHSYKDVPVTMPLVDESNLVIAAVPKREDPRDVAVMRDPSKGVLPAGSKIGTCSLRRRCQILTAVPDAQMLDLRGNIDTRIKKLRDGQYDVIVLAMAGLKRANLFDATFMSPLPIVPAAGQGALAIQCRRDDARTRKILSAINDHATETCVNAERQIVETLNADCHSPVAALAVAYNNDEIELNAAVGRRGGEPPVIYATARSDVKNAVHQVIDQLNRQGADRLLRG